MNRSASSSVSRCARAAEVVHRIEAGDAHREAGQRADHRLATHRVAIERASAEPRAAIESNTLEHAAHRAEQPEQRTQRHQHAQHLQVRGHPAFSREIIARADLVRAPARVIRPCAASLSQHPLDLARQDAA